MYTTHTFTHTLTQHIFIHTYAHTLLVMSSLSILPPLDLSGIGSLRINITSSQVLLLWQPPQALKGKILSYVIRYEEVRVGGVFGEVQSFVAGYRTRALKVFGLTPLRTYDFTVYAVTSDGEVVVTTLEHRPQT